MRNQIGWALELIDHTLKPLLSPFLSNAKGTAPPTPTIPGEILQTLTNVTNTVLTYPNLKALAKTVLSPALSVAFGLVGDLGEIAGDVSSANIGGALTDILKTPADLTGDLLNGYVYPSAQYNPTGTPFTGLLNGGSVLDDLLHTWPNLVSTALGATTTAATTSAVAQVASTKVASAASSTSVGIDAVKDSAARATTADTKTTTITALTKDGTGTKGAGSAGINDAGASSSNRSANNGDTGPTSKGDTGSGHSHSSNSASSHSSGK